MIFFNTLCYSSNIPEDISLFGKAERMANILRAPSQWLLEDRFGLPQTYEIRVKESRSLNKFYPCDLWEIRTTESPSTIVKVLKVVLSIPGQFLAFPLMALAFCSEEIRLKYKFTALTISTYDKQKFDKVQEKLADLITRRVGSCLLSK